MFFLIGIIISVFLFGLLVMKRNKSQADRILMWWMAVMSLHQILSYANYSGLDKQYPHLLGLIMPFPAIHGALVFVYVSAMTREKPLRWNQILPHLGPFFLLTVLAIPFYILPAEKKLEVFQHQGAGFEWYVMIHRPVVLVTGLGYVTWSLIRIHRHRARIKQWFSNTEKISLRWLEYLSIGLGVIWVLVIFFDDHVIFSGVVVLVLFIGFFGINQLPIFYSHPDLTRSVAQQAGDSFDDLVSTPEDAAADSDRYAKSGLKEAEADDLHRRLTRLMREQELYKRNDITLADLAALLDTHPNYLSQVINVREQKNFYHYINTLRVRAFIEAKDDPAKKHYSFLALAFDCGFNSKSTFNKYFKTYTGKTPSEFSAN